MYSDVLSDIYGVLANVPYRTFPSSYQGQSGGPPYILSTVLMPNVKANSYNMCCKEFKGMLILSIYVSSDAGEKLIYEMADTINQLIEWQVLPNGTHLQTSSIEIIGHDDINRSLYRADYKVPFTHYGA
jgi:hypothetical protein